MAQNNFEKGTYFRFSTLWVLSGEDPLKSRMGIIQSNFLCRRIILKREIFLQAEEKTLSIIGMSYKVAHNVFDKEEETMSIIHLQRRKLPMDAHLAPLILSNAPKLLTSKHFQRITKGKQELYERLFDFSPLRRSLSLSLTNKSETKKWIYGVYVKLFQFQSFELFLKNIRLIFTVTFKY